MGDDIWGQLAVERSQVYIDDGTGVLRSPFANTTIEKLPDKVLLHIFSYLTHREICNLARVCRKWRRIAYDTRLWRAVSLRPEVSGLHVLSLESLLALISVRFGPSLRYIELPIELITHTVLHELANKCPNLTHMLLDFSTAMQLHDFSELQTFPAKLRYLCICLSEVIFMEGFMRKIYNFINGLEILHLIGTYEKVEEEEEEIYEVINVHKLKSATPNLRVINLFGINFIDDSHIDAFSSNCIQLECLAVNFCNKVTGSTMKTLFQRSRRLTTLLMNQTSLQSEHVMTVEWDKCSVQELDITGTDLSTECLIDMLTRLQNLRFLRAGQINGFNDSVLKAWMEQGNTRSLLALDLDASDNITDDMLHKFLVRQGPQLHGLVLSGMPHINDQLWMSVLPILTNAKILVMGTSERLGVNIHVDQLMDGIANNCTKLERLELRWDPENLRFSDKSQKAIDILRVKCLKLKSLVLSMKVLIPEMEYVQFDEPEMNQQSSQSAAVEDKKWRDCFDQGIRLSGTGLAVGSVISLLLFRGWPSIFGTGVGLAMAVDRCIEQFGQESVGARLSSRKVLGGSPESVFLAMRRPFGSRQKDVAPPKEEINDSEKYNEFVSEEAFTTTYAAPINLI